MNIGENFENRPEVYGIELNFSALNLQSYGIACPGRV